MEVAGSKVYSERAAVLSELNAILSSTQNLVKELRSLLVLTDPESGALAQSQQQALSSVDVWKSLFAAVEPDSDTA